MNFFRNPSWLKLHQYPYGVLEEVPQELFDRINNQLDKKISTSPVVSIVIAAWNEEVNILRCISTLAGQKTDLPYEIIVVNNNSTDKTQATLDKLHIRSFFQEIQGPGPARQVGQLNARGKYILLADADCFYPEHWLEKMTEVLSMPGIVCVYGRYSFISEPGYPRWMLACMEKMKDVAAEFRHIKRPYFNTYGLSMGYITALGLKIGFAMKNVRGEDGRMSLALMEYGKIKQVKTASARVWTGPRTLQKDGTLLQALGKRVKKEFKNFFYNLRSTPPEETNNINY